MRIKFKKFQYTDLSEVLNVKCVLSTKTDSSINLKVKVHKGEAEHKTFIDVEISYDMILMPIMSDIK